MRQTDVGEPRRDRARAVDHRFGRTRIIVHGDTMTRFLGRVQRCWGSPDRPTLDAGLAASSREQVLLSDRANVGPIM
jgi:hypothetical protein